MIQLARDLLPMVPYMVVTGIFVSIYFLTAISLVKYIIEDRRKDQ